MNKKIIAGLLTILALCNITMYAPYTVHADYTRTFTRSFPVWLSKFTIGRGMLRSWTLCHSKASLWALPTIFLGNILAEKVFKATLPESIAQHIVHPDEEKIRSEYEQEKNEIFNNYEQMQDNYEQLIHDTQIFTALTTAAILGTIWLAHTYKDTIINTIKPNTQQSYNPNNLYSVLSACTTVNEAIQTLKKHGWNRMHLQNYPNTLRAPANFTQEQVMQIINAL